MIKSLLIRSKLVLRELEVSEENIIDLHRDHMAKQVQKSINRFTVSPEECELIFKLIK